MMMAPKPPDKKEMKQGENEAGAAGDGE